MIFLSPHHRGIVGAPPSEDFVAEIETTTPDESFTWRFSVGGTYSATIDYGDGSPLGTITAHNDPDRTHIYSTPGVHTVTMSGQIGGFGFFGSAESSKLRRILNFGNNVITGSLNQGFRGTSVSAVNGGDLALCTDFYRCFMDAGSLANFNIVSLGDVNMQQVFSSNTSLTSVSIGSIGDVTSLLNGFSANSSLTSLNIGSIGTGGNYSAANCFFECFALPEMPAVDFSGGSNFSAFCRDCSSLKTFPANAFDTCLATVFTNGFRDCALDQQSVDNILISIDLAGQSSGTLSINGGTSSPPGPAGNVAKANLQARGWNVFTN